ncbi:hypothetical protein [Owenweeksia hongkongensis]|uniref:hypothetical protein n=1 Tax=Owenweeksia hongkongensis TaxID=253245 RepID=UPI003A9598F2
MLDLLDVTSADIEKLSDSDLRVLIGRLCEADFRRNHLSTNQIYYGGHQDAGDGGVDVEVKANFNPPKNSQVRKRNTVFQVKKSDMSRAKILQEMCPSGVLREEIKELIRVKGAYLIVSSVHATGRQLKNRVSAMKEAIKDWPGHKNLTIDFLEANDIASWVRSHESLIIWVRDKVGRPLYGWQPYGNWTGYGHEEYVIDNQLRLRDGSNSANKLADVSSGLSLLQGELSNAGHSIRLTGLSGVGKTRFVEALFDSRISDEALNPSEAIYCDVGDKPNPSPEFMLEQLVKSQSNVILIIDNCKEKLHNRLSKMLLKRKPNNVKLLTIEYDVREEVPEETNVYKLEPASDNVIDKILEKRFKHVSSLNRRTIAEFAGGNSRVAIYLARTIKANESLTKLSDNELFERLFWQRHEVNGDLFEAGQVFSLLYSFNGEDISEDSELDILGSFVGRSATDLYKYVRILQERELIQARSKWRAVLPHVIANRLAKKTLSRIHTEVISNRILQSSERVVKSFTRRLSFLHDCPEAMKIVELWLGPDGWIGKNYLNLNFFGMEVLNNISVVSPQKTLELFEAAACRDDADEVFSRKNTRYHTIVSILMSLAYDQEYFERSVKLLIRLALTEKPGENSNSIRADLDGLFHIYLSNTHATLTQKRQIISDLLRSENDMEQEIGLSLLRAALKASHFTSFGHRSFGARPRDYGYWPQTNEEVINWYKTFITDCNALCINENSVALEAKTIVAESFRTLCKSEELLELLENLAVEIRKGTFWLEGWVSVRDVIYYDPTDFEESDLERIKMLEKKLRPNTLEERATAVLLYKHHLDYDPVSEVYETYEKGRTSKSTEENEKRMNLRALEIGAKAVNDQSLLDRLVPKLLTNSYHRSFSFGMGLGFKQTPQRKRDILSFMRDQLIKVSPEQHYLALVKGLLHQWKEDHPEDFEKTLDEIACDQVFGSNYPELQCAVGINERGFLRLIETLQYKNANIRSYSFIAWGRAHEALSNASLVKLIDLLFRQEKGYIVVVEILYMRLHSNKQNKLLASEALIETSRKVLEEYRFKDAPKTRYDRTDYRLYEIASFALIGERGFYPAKTLCSNLLESIANYEVSLHDYEELINEIVLHQPLAFLDTFLETDAGDPHFARVYTHNDFHENENPFDKINDKVILKWCQSGSSSRYEKVIRAFPPFIFKKGESIEWRPILFEIIARAKDLTKVLEELSHSLRPMVVNGSRADIMTKRLKLYQDLFDHSNPVVKEWARKSFEELKISIANYEKREVIRTQGADESFE